MFFESFVQCLGRDGDRVAAVAGELLGSSVGGVGFEEEPFLCQPPDFVALGTPLKALASAAGGWCLAPAPSARVQWLFPVGVSEVSSA